METKSAVSEGLKTMSDTVPGGPTGGVVWPRGMERRPPSGVRPLAWSVEKQVTPATAPPLMTQASMLAESGTAGEERTSLELWGVCHRGGELAKCGRGIEEFRCRWVCFVDEEH